MDSSLGLFVGFCSTVVVGAARFQGLLASLAFFVSRRKSRRGSPPGCKAGGGAGFVGGAINFIHSSILR